MWLRVDRVRRPLEAPYQGPYEVLNRTQRTFTIAIRGKPSVVSIDRLKPACLQKKSNEDQDGQTTLKEVEDISSKRSERTTRSGRRVQFHEKPGFFLFVNAPLPPRGILLHLNSYISLFSKISSFYLFFSNIIFSL